MLAGSEHGHVPRVLYEAQFKAVVMHCLSLVMPVRMIAAFARAEHDRRPNSILYKQLWADLAYLHVPPRGVATALWCQRPDIIFSVHRLYGGWLEQCRNPQAIDQVLEHLLKSAWHVESLSSAFSVLLRRFCVASGSHFVANAGSSGYCN